MASDLRRMNGIELIAAERQRQIDKEGWTPDHDAQHEGGELALAAACYATGEPIFVQRTYTIGGRIELPHFHFQNVWPFADHWWKPKDELRNLVRAGALIAAEVDRLLAATPSPEGQDG